jgi:elongin-A
MVVSLLELCVRSAIDNLQYLGDVGETDIQLLKRILPHCNAEQLNHIETSTKVRF